MAQYIDKSALVAEIKGYISNYKEIVAKINRNDSTWVDSVSMIDAKIDVLQHVLFFLDTLEVKDIQEEPVSNDLEEAARKIATRHSHITGDTYYANDAWFFKKGAQWQKKQMEKNRIAHCDNITEEQYNLETGFIDSFLDKNKRMPTFLDAIEYGMKKAQKG